MDWTAILLDPNYAAFGVDATLTIAPGTTDQAEHSLTVIDKTSGVPVTGAAGFEVETITPAAVVRMAELTAASVARTALDRGTIEFNGKTWAITSHILRPSPGGEADGEVMLLLAERD